MYVSKHSMGWVKTFWMRTKQGLTETYMAGTEIRTEIKLSNLESTGYVY